MRGNETIMATVIEQRQLNSPDVSRRVNALRRTDNVTNWFYLAREYLFFAAVLGATIAFYEGRAAWGLAWAWNVPVTLLAVAVVGALQHRLTTLAHEASHYILFRNRLLNELASDFLCMFPMWSTTHQYRLQHLAHHQFPNDPERDPDVAQMEASGHRFDFPMRPGRFLWECVLKQMLWVPGLIRYIRMRARFVATGGGSGPYLAPVSRSKLLVLVGLVYLALLALALTAVVRWGEPWMLAAAPAALLTPLLTFYLLVPAGWYRQSFVRPDVTPRWMTVFRVTYLTGLFTVLAALTWATGRPWPLYYIVLWLVPLGTSFSFYMLLRQIVQHGNAGGGRLTNTRVFLVGRLIRWSVFPLGMEYHLPHHLFPLVPHYRLKQLHELLLGAADYRDAATVVEGYFWHRRPPEHPTVVELMAGPRA